MTANIGTGVGRPRGESNHRYGVMISVPDMYVSP